MQFFTSTAHKYAKSHQRNTCLSFPDGIIIRNQNNKLINKGIRYGFDNPQYQTFVKRYFHYAEYLTYATELANQWARWNDNTKNSNSIDRNMENNYFGNFEIAQFPIKYTNLFGVENKIELGDNFMRIMETVFKMDNTFGLCGVLAIMASGLIKNFKNWKDLYFNPIEAKEFFDKNIEHGRTYVQKFREEQMMAGRIIAYKFHSFIRNNYENILMRHYDNHRVGVLGTVLCEYAGYKGFHTHWLSITPLPHLCGTKVLVAGDLTPFGIKELAIIMEEFYAESIISNSLNKIVSTLIREYLEISSDSAISNEKVRKNLATFLY